jgi:branched-chain amino acid transport system substrate-binding protein
MGFALLLAGCGKKPTQDGKPTPVPEDPHTTRIGFFAPLTGGQASFGNDAIRGAELAGEEINATGGVLGHPVKLVVKDTRSSTSETSSVVNQLISEDKVAVLIGEIATDRSLVAAPLAQAGGVPMITPGATNEQVTSAGDFVFRVCYTDSFQAAMMAKFARSINAVKGAILYDPSSPYSSGLAESFKKDFAAHGGQMVAEERYRAGARDFSSQLEAIKAKLPDIIFLPSYYADAAFVIHQARQAGIDAPFLGTDGWDSPEFLKVGGEAVNNCYFSCHFAAESETADIKRFVDAYTARYGVAPPPLAALTYDAVYLAIDALKRAGSPEAVPLRDALAATREFPGVTGKITFDKNRNPTKPGVVIRVEDGQFTYLETVEPPTHPTPAPTPPN